VKKVVKAELRRQIYLAMFFASSTLVTDSHPTLCCADSLAVADADAFGQRAVGALPVPVPGSVQPQPRHQHHESMSIVGQWIPRTRVCMVGERE